MKGWVEVQGRLKLFVMAYLANICRFYHKILERHSAQLDILLKAGVGVVCYGAASARNVNI
jgi:hypothetical protein